MTSLATAKNAFRFYTRLHLQELTGLKAFTLPQLLELARHVPESCIYHHTHRFLQQHMAWSPEPPNDFAYWAAEALGDNVLSERLASIDIIQCPTIKALRKKIVSTMESYLQENPLLEKKSASEEGAFHFIRSVSFVLPTDYEVFDLQQFAEGLKKVTVDSIYFHIFEARLRTEKKTNDFSAWMETSLGEKALADAIARLDPYTQTLADLRKAILRVIEKRMR